jgi:hypothetical protein
LHKVYYDFKLVFTQPVFAEFRQIPVNLLYMKLKISLVVVICCQMFGYALYAQNVWKHYYGLPNKTFSTDITETYDKGYMIGGIIQRQNHNRTGWIEKTDINGNSLYRIVIGIGDIEESLFSFDKTSEGGFIVGGWFGSGVDDLDADVLKFNACGEKEWCTVIRSPVGTQTSIDGGIHEVPGGGYIAHRSIYSFANDDRVSLMKLRNDGSVEWINSYANSAIWENEADHHIIVTSDTCFLVSGFNYYPIVPGLMYPCPYWYKVDRDGNLLWIHTWELKTYQSPGEAWVAMEDKHGNYYSGGKMYSPYGIPYLYKLSKDGDTIASYPFGSVPEPLGGDMYSINPLNDTTLIIGANYSMTDHDYSWSVNKTDTLGNVLVRVTEEEDFVINPSIITSDGKILINGGKLGNSSWPPYYVGLYKFNSNLEYDSIYTMPRTYDSLCPHPIVSDTIPMPDNCVYVSLPEEPKVGELQPLKLYPNPASDYVSVELPEYAVTSDKQGVMTESRYRPITGECELMVYDIHGRLVYSETLDAGGRNHVIITSSWRAGIYLVELEQKGLRIAEGKVVKSEVGKSD